MPFLARRRSTRQARFCHRQRFPPFPPVAEPLGGLLMDTSHKGTDKLTCGHGLSRHNSALGAGNRVACSHFTFVYWVE
jgi:hypothetical protein